MNNHDRKRYGDLAIRAGAPDYSENDIVTNAGDAIANILHAVTAECGAEAATGIVNTATNHFDAEYDGDGFSPLPDPPEHLADAWKRYQEGGGAGVEPHELRALDEWRYDAATDAGF